MEFSNRVLEKWEKAFDVVAKTPCIISAVILKLFSEAYCIFIIKTLNLWEYSVDTWKIWAHNSDDLIVGISGSANSRKLACCYKKCLRNIIIKEISRSQSSRVRIKCFHNRLVLDFVIYCFSIVCSLKNSLKLMNCPFSLALKKIADSFFLNLQNTKLTQTWNIKSTFRWNLFLYVPKISKIAYGWTQARKSQIWFFSFFNFLFVWA